MPDMRSPRISFLIHTFLLILLLPLTVQAADRGMKVISIKFNPGAELKINRDSLRPRDIEMLYYQSKSWKDFLLRYINHTRSNSYPGMGGQPGGQIINLAPDLFAGKIPSPPKLKLCWDSAEGEFVKCETYQTFGEDITVEVERDINNFFLPATTKKLKICWDMAQFGYVECGTYGTYGDGIEVMVMVSQMVSISQPGEVEGCWDSAQAEFVACGRFGTYN